LARRPGAASGLILIVVVAVSVIVAIMLAVTGPSWKAPPEAIARPNPIPITDASIAAGKSIYAERCASCHGDAGDGKGSESGRYATKPADFSDAKLMQAMTDGEFFWKITVGNRPMPTFKNKLSEEQRWQVIDYIRTFSQPQLYSPVPPAAPPSAPR
jgi:mono/diheme cytochrome c family protein